MCVCTLHNLDIMNLRILSQIFTIKRLRAVYIIQVIRIIFIKKGPCMHGQNH